MTDVLQRRSTGNDPDGLDDLEWEPSPRPSSRRRFSRGGRAARFARVRRRADPSRDGAVAHGRVDGGRGSRSRSPGCCRSVSRIAVWRRPTQLALWIGIALNAAFIGAWVWTRTAGSPWGPNAGHAESASFVDITCVVLEGSFILGALVVLAAPGHRAAGSPPTGPGSPAIVPVVVVLFATAAIASPERPQPRPRRPRRPGGGRRSRARCGGRGRPRVGRRPRPRVRRRQGSRACCTTATTPHYAGRSSTR